MRKVAENVRYRKVKSGFCFVEIMVFWDVVQHRQVGTRLLDCTASHPRRLIQILSSLLLILYISFHHYSSNQILSLSVI